MRPRVSVIIPACNHEAFVGQAIESVYAQTLRDVELIVLDDCSTDGTAGVIEEKLQTAPFPARLLRREAKLGGAGAVNRLLEEARGEYVALLNSDDEFLPNKLKYQAAFLDCHRDVTACFTWVKFIDEQGSECPEQPKLFDVYDRPRAQWLKKLFFEGNCLCHPSVMARRKDCTLRMDPRLAKLPDLELWTRLLQKRNIAVIPQRLTRFRIRKDQQNASSKTARTLALINHETPYVLDNYLELSREDCLEVFGRTGSAALRKYYAYTAALSLAPAYAAWGVRGLYAMMADPVARAELTGAGFDLESLYELCGGVDVYGELPLVSKLYYADIRHRLRSSMPFSENRMVSCALPECREFSCSFPLCRSVAMVRFDPCERPCTVELREAYALREGRRIDLLASAEHNGAQQGGCVRFSTMDPWFTFSLGREQYVENITVNGSWHLS